MRKCVRLLAILMLAATAAQADDQAAVARAVARAGLSARDPLPEKISKALRLLNDRHYFQPTTRQHEGPRYELDSLRTPGQILSEKRGGGCGSAALAFTALLEASGVPDSDLRIVGAVVNSDHATICPVAGRPRAREPRTGASGHVFVMVRDKSGAWTLYNTTDSAGRVSSTPMPAPSELARLAAAGPVEIPRDAYRTILDIPEIAPVFESGLTIFAVWRLGEYPRHTFEGRLNLVASGTLASDVCHYGSADVLAANLRGFPTRPAPSSCR